MPAAFLYTNHFDSAVFYADVGTAAVASLPLSNLRDPQPRIRARWQPASCAVFVDFGAPREIACVALISTTLGSVLPAAPFYAPGGATLRARLSDDAGFGTSTWDTGTISPQTDAAANGNVVMVHPTSATGRFLRIDVSSPTALYLDIGRIAAGPLWRPVHQPAIGSAEGRQILDRRDRNAFTGAEFPVPAVVNPRMATFTLPLITRAEATAEFRTMLAQLGAVGDVLWIPDDAAGLSELNRRAIWGAVAQPGDSALLARPYHIGHSRAFTLAERV